MARTKTISFLLKMTPEENEWVDKRMAQTNISNKSAYLRKMAIDGHVIILDTKTIKEVGRLLAINANNLNQLTKRVNSGGNAPRDDVALISQQFTEIQEQFGKALTALDGINNMKPGTLYMPLLRLRDYRNQQKQEPPAPQAEQGA
jgi:hypothetical protein